jgi:hypothetical protein
MTTPTQKQTPLHFTVGTGRGWKDAFVVTSLVIVLGAFIAQISSTPKAGQAIERVTSAATAVTAGNG